MVPIFTKSHNFIILQVWEVVGEEEEVGRSNQQTRCSFMMQLPHTSLCLHLARALLSLFHLVNLLTLGWLYFVNVLHSL